MNFIKNNNKQFKVNNQIKNFKKQKINLKLNK